MKSPCVRNCCLDDNDICLGCFRSIEEIVGWSSATEEEQRAIIANAEQRRHEYELKFNRKKP